MAGERSEFAFSFTDAATGRPVADLQPYLAAAGHVVIMRSDATTFAHEHADVEDGNGNPVFALPGQEFGPELDVHAEFATPGIYRLWAQFRLGRRRRADRPVHRRGPLRGSRRWNRDDLPLPGETLDVLVVGAGQAGLALGRYLQQRDARFLLVDAGARVGDVWRARWDSLRLFTAAEHDGLPDLPFPGEPGTYPGKDAVADYLEGYAATFDLPVRLGTRVTRLSPATEGFTAETSTGPVQARQVVVATGPFSAAHIPAAAAGSTRRSSRCTARSTAARPTFPTGRSWSSGPGTPACRSPTNWPRPGGRSRWRSVPGRGRCRNGRWAATCSGGSPAPACCGRRWTRGWVAVSGTASWSSALVAGAAEAWRRPAAAAASVRPVARSRSTDGTATDVAAVVWATGFRPDHGWLDVPGAVVDGAPVHARGVSPVPGLFFLGLPWQHTRGSALLGFVQEDAAWLTERLLAARASEVEAGRGLSGTPAVRE